MVVCHRPVEGCPPHDGRPVPAHDHYGPETAPIWRRYSERDHLTSRSQCSDEIADALDAVGWPKALPSEDLDELRVILVGKRLRSYGLYEQSLSLRLANVGSRSAAHPGEDLLLRSFEIHEERAPYLDKKAGSGHLLARQPAVRSSTCEQPSSPKAKGISASAAARRSAPASSRKPIDSVPQPLSGLPRILTP